MSKTSVDIIIVSYNSIDLIDRCLLPISNEAERLGDVYVVDNFSNDGTADYIEENYPWVRLIRSEENLGFARGNNLAAQISTAEHMLLLNPDAFLSSPETVLALSAALDENPELAATAPKLVNVDGSHQVGDSGWRTSLLTAFGHAFLLQRLFKSWPGLYLSNQSLLRAPYVDVDWVCGACMMIRRAAWDEIGGLDEAIFMYGEDVEWGERARAADWRLRYLPQISVLHLQGATQKRKLGEPFFSTKWLDSRLQRLRSTRSALALMMFRLIMFIGFGLQAIGLWLASCGRDSRRLKSAHKGRYALHALTAQP